MGGTVLTILKQVLDKAGYTYSINGYPFKRLYRNVAKSKVDVFIGTKDAPAYKGKAIYGHSLIDSVDLRIYGLPGVVIPSSSFTEKLI